MGRSDILQRISKNIHEYYDLVKKKAAGSLQTDPFTNGTLGNTNSHPA